MFRFWSLSCVLPFDYAFFAAAGPKPDAYPTVATVAAGAAGVRWTVPICGEYRRAWIPPAGAAAGPGLPGPAAPGLLHGSPVYVHESASPADAHSYDATGPSFITQNDELMIFS